MVVVILFLQEEFQLCRPINDLMKQRSIVFFFSAKDGMEFNIALELFVTNKTFEFEIGSLEKFLI